MQCSNYRFERDCDFTLRKRETIFGRRTHPFSSDKCSCRLYPSEASQDLTLMSNSPAIRLPRVSFSHRILLHSCWSPVWSLTAMTMVRVEPKGTIPDTGGAQGPLPCWISIQQSTLSPVPKKLLNGLHNSVTLISGGLYCEAQVYVGMLLFPRKIHNYRRDWVQNTAVNSL